MQPSYSAPVYCIVTKPKSEMSSRRITLSNNKMIAGVCGGIADYLGLDPTLVRVAYVLLSLLSAAFPGIIVYIIAWILMPKR